MTRLLLRAATIAAIASVMGCASMEIKSKKDEILCPRCKVRVVRHRFSRSGSQGHRHVKYICPSCGKEWSGKIDTTGGEGLLCPKCGCVVMECPQCGKKR